MLAWLAAAFVGACDCDGKKDKCDLKPTIQITRPGSTELTEFHDTNTVEQGIQYPVTVRTIGVPGDTELSYTNDRRAGETVVGKVVMEDEETLTGHVEFGDQTFETGSNHICVRGEVHVNRMVDGSSNCGVALADAEHCLDINVRLGVPACRFDQPTDGATLTDDPNPSRGFQHDVWVSCKGVNDGEVVGLIVNDRAPIEGSLDTGAVWWDDVDLAEGRNVLRAETTGASGENVSAEIGVTVDTGACALYVLPPDGTVFRTDDDEDPVADGLQVTLTIHTDSAGKFVCADGSDVRLFVAGDEYQGTISDGSVALEATLRDGIIPVYATAQEPADGRTGESLTNRYFVCASPIALEITAPRDGLTITDTADRDSDQAGIQVAVGGNSSGVPAAENMRLLVDGVMVTNGIDPLVPVVFFPGGDFEFQYATFSLSKDYSIQVAGTDACVVDCGIDANCAPGEQCIDRMCMRPGPIHTVFVQTEQRTCLIADPQNNAVLLAANDKDLDEANGLQYDVHVVTENVPDDSTFTLYVSGQDPQSGLVVQNSLSVNTITFTTVDVLSEDKTLQCVLDTGEASPATTVTVDGHTPTMEILGPADSSSFDHVDITLDLLTTGVEDGVEATVTMASGVNTQDYRCTVTGNTARCDVTLFAQVGVETSNTITASVSDLAGNPSPQDVIAVLVLVVSAPPVVTFTDPDETLPQPITVAEGDRAYSVVVNVLNLIEGAPVDLVVADNGLERPAISVDLDDQGVATFPNVLLPRGTVQLKASASNLLGPDESTVDLLVGDTSLPVVIITAPPDQTYTQQNTFDVTVGSDVEAGQTCYVCARVTPATPSLPAVCFAGSPPIAQGATDAGGDVTVSVTLSEDDFELWASCTNQATQTGTSIPVRVVVDQTPPVVQFNEPREGAVYNAQSPDRSGQPGFQIRVQLAADVEDGQAAALNLDGYPAVIIGDAPVFDNGLIDIGAVTVLHNAAQQLGANVCDKAGNCADATPVNITVDRWAPDVTITNPPDLARLGTSSDESAAIGFQIDVTGEFVNAAAGDTVVLEHKIGAGAWTQLASHTLTASDAGTGYTFNDATIVPDDGTANDPKDVQLRATITDDAANSDSHQITVTVNRADAEVTITRPANGQNLNINADMGSEPGMQVQVDVDTYHTEFGDFLAICAAPGTGYPEGRCAGYGREVWSGTITGVLTIAWGVNLVQGDNTLVAFAENIPGQGTYSDPVTVHVDSVPPTVDSLVVTSDVNVDGCLSLAEGGLRVTVTISGAADGRIVRLIQDWPAGVEIARAPLSGGSATLSASPPDGDYDLTAVVTDAFGNPNVSVSPEILDPEATFSVTVDTTAPTVSISEPSKSTLNRSDDLNVSTQDLDFLFVVATNAEDLQPVLFEIDSNPVGIAAVSGGAASLQAAVGQGSRTLRVSVNDFCGNPSVPATAGIFVDTIKPTVTCSQPQDDEVFTVQQVQFVCATTGTDSTQSITVTSTVGGERCSIAVDGSGTTTFTCTLLGGVQTLSVTVTDPAGNLSDPDTIGNVNVNIAGCDIAFVGLSGLVVFNADDDNDGNPDNGLQIDLTAQSGNCNGTNCPGCRATLKLNGTPFGSAQPLDSSGNVTFQNVQFQNDDTGVDVEVELDDGSSGITTDVFTVELVDLYPPQVGRDAPGSDNVTCVAFRGNPNEDGLVVLADKIDGIPCEMDFAFTVDDGGDMTYPGSLAIQQGGSPIAGPTDIVSAQQMVSYVNVQLAHDATHALNVVAGDYAGNTVSIPMTVEVDVLAPGQVSISNAAVSHSRHADVNLTWTAPGDDAETGTATAYAIRWARDAIGSETEWVEAQEISNTLSPGVPGTTENFTAQWLPPLNTYHLAIRAVDEVGNYSPIPSDLAVSNLWNEVNYFGPGGNFGYNVWNIGDVNNDNRDDVAVNAVTLDSNSGAVFVFYGEADLSNWSSPGAPQKLSRGLGGELLGWDVCGQGDLDGDGIPDLGVTGRGFDGNRGRISIYFGRDGSQLPDQPDVEIRGVIDTADRFGRSAEIIGDINNDGFDDLFVAAPTASANGRGYIFFGQSRNDWIAAATDSDASPHPPGNYIPAGNADINILGVDVDDWFGYLHGNTTLGDLDGDGYDEFALVASKVNEVYTFNGATVSGITTRDVNPNTDSVDVISYGDPYDDGGFYGGFGVRAVGGVDLTGDGLADLVVSAAFHKKVYLFSGIDSPTVKIDPTFTKEITWAEHINFGWDLEVADVNMDGWPDLLLGTNSSAGHRAFLFFNMGTSPYFLDLPGATLTGSDYYGIGTAVGDYNGDGLPDIALGSLADVLYVHY
jgi:hypothetical protein